jgi:ubiquinone/menaquinone biosynthesis C-methylase UbiE
MEVEELKERSRATWASGDYPSIAELIQSAADDLVEAAEIGKKMEVLDVATGTGNVAIPAAEKGGKVTGVDLTPELFDTARKRAEKAGVKVEWVEGDAEALPFDDSSFDRVLSTFGVMFAPRHKRAAGELIRVLRPGGLIGLCSWTPDGVAGQMFKIAGAYLPRPPEFVQPPAQWGNEKHVRELFAGSGLSLTFERRAVTMTDESPEAFLEMMSKSFGPFVQAQAILNEQQWSEMRAELLDLYSSSNKAEDGTLLFDQEYLRVIARDS